MEMIEELKRFWTERNIRISGQASEAEISAFETRHNVRMPATVKSFYREINGVEFDRDMLTFWPLSQVASVPVKVPSFQGIPNYRGIDISLPEAGSYYAFADWSIWSHVYALRLTRDIDQSAPVIWIGNGQTWRVLFESFDAFLTGYLRDYDSVLFPTDLRSR